MQSMILQILVPCFLVGAPTFSDNGFSFKEYIREDFTLAGNTSQIPDYVKRMSSFALEEELQAFEDHISDLGFVSLDNVRRGIVVSPLDMEERRKYFSEAGWFEYLAYVDSRKGNLLPLKGRYEHPQSSLVITYGTQIYSREATGHGFSAEVGFCYSSFDVWDCKGASHAIGVVTEGSFDRPSEMIIHSWKLKPKRNK